MVVTGSTAPAFSVLFRRMLDEFLAHAEDPSAFRMPDHPAT